MVKRGLGFGASVTVLMACMSMPAFAQSDDQGDENDEIVVTAQHKAQSLQDVPLSITALSGESLEARGVTDFRDYAAQVPNLAFGYTQSLGGTSQTVTLRGVFGSGTTGFYLNDAPLPASIDPRVLDLERIEVLRGPQGTLYGARSMGGTVRLITREPDATAFSGSALVRGSTTRHGGENGSIDGAINVPLVDGLLAVRASGYYETVSGVYDRVPSAAAPVKFAPRSNVDSSHRYGGTIALAADLGAVTVTPRYMFQRGVTDGRSLADIAPGNYTQSRLFDIDEPGSDDWDLGTLTVDYDTGKGHITAATTVFGRSVHESEDASEVLKLLFGTPAIAATFVATSRYHSTAQELRYASDFGGPIDLTGGLFYQNTSNRTYFPPEALAGVTSNVYTQDFRTEVTEYAAFGEVTVTPANGVRLIAGARVFDSEVNFKGSQGGAAVTPGSFAGRQKENGINPHFAAQFDAGKDAMLYVSAAKGFRTGGVNAFPVSRCAAALNALNINPNDALSYKSDSLWSYEVGAKTRWFNHKLTVNAAAFRIDWSNVQQGLSLSCGFGVQLNAGKARSQGGELELQVSPVDGLNLNFGAGYTDATITDGGGNPAFPNGARIQQVPHWTVNGGADLDLDAGFPLTLHGDFSYVGQSFSRSNSPLTRRVRPEYTLVNLRATAHLGGMDIGVFAENLLDEAANLSDLPSLAEELPGRPRIVTNRPRTIGIEGRIKF